MSVTVIRAVTLPVAEPVGSSWEALRPTLDACFRLSTHAANWCVQQLYRRDTVGEPKTPDAVRMGRESDGRFYAYGAASREPWFADWAGAKQGLNIVLQYAHRKYLRERFDVMVRHRHGLLSVRHPYPFPVDADGVKLSHDAGGFPVVSLQLPGVGSTPLRLKRRADFGRQLAMFRQLADGTAGKGEAALYRDRKGMLLVKLVGRFPVRPRGERVHACALSTDPAALLVAQIDGRPPWVLNFDHLRRWQAAHRSYLRRSGDDLKREKRTDRRQRAAINGSRRLRCEKHGDRIDTAVHQATAQVVRFCERAGVRVVVYDDARREFLPDGFPWHALEERLRYKLEGVGIGFVGWSDDPKRKALPTEGDGRWAMMLAAATAAAGMKVVAGRSRAGSHPAVSRPRGTSSTPRSTRSKTCSTTRNRT